MQINYQNLQTHITVWTEKWNNYENEVMESENEENIEL